MQRRWLLLAVLALVASVTLPHLVHAAVGSFTGPIIPNVSDANGNLQTCAAGFGGFSLIIGGALSLAISLGILIAVLVLVYGGFLLILNPVNAENRTKAKTVLMNAAVGFLITLAAWIIINTLLTTLGAGGVAGATKGLFGGGTCLAVHQQKGIDGGATNTDTGNGVTGGDSQCPSGQTCQPSNWCGPLQTSCNGHTCSANQVCGTDGNSCISAQHCTYTPPSSGGSCQVQQSGACAASQMGAFGSQANNASEICFAESSGNAHAEGDRIVGGVSNGNPVSFGLFQVNVTANRMGGLDCPSAFDSVFTGSHKNVVIKNQSLYAQCKAAGEDPAQNIQAALSISHNGTNWRPWSTASKCGLALTYFPTLALGEYCPYNSLL